MQKAATPSDCLRKRKALPSQAPSDWEILWKSYCKLKEDIGKKAKDADRMSDVSSASSEWDSECEDAPVASPRRDSTAHEKPIMKPTSKARACPRPVFGGTTKALNRPCPDSNAVIPASRQLVPRPPRSPPPGHGHECRYKSRSKIPAAIRRLMESDMVTASGRLEMHKVDNVLYSQSGCSRNFRDGRSLEDLISELNRGEHDPLTTDFLTLNCVRISEKIYSYDNRRLYCLKQFQKQMQEQKLLDSLRIRVDVVDIDPQLGGFLENALPSLGPQGTSKQLRHIVSFLEHFDTQNAGTHIHVRKGNSQHRRRVH
eukprot:TRINITY_DN14437_c0_g1_i1.p1 TRINITY_DN14437_c0_g1~~TRINITY_DN14437_c0_g1_i1.p1  ORF type:complete len:314 (-),score=38.47 TRINITY_DN14437_c0_g1_i1:21-962(-)